MVWKSFTFKTYEEDEAHHDRSNRRAHKSQGQEGYSTCKLPSGAHIAICNMCNIEIEIKTTEGGQKKLLLLLVLSFLVKTLTFQSSCGSRTK